MRCPQIRLDLKSVVVYTKLRNTLINSTVFKYYYIKQGGATIDLFLLFSAIYIYNIKLSNNVIVKKTKSRISDKTKQENIHLVYELTER